MTRPLLTPLEAVVLNVIRDMSAAGYGGANLAQIARVVAAAGYGRLSLPLTARTVYRLGRRGFVVRSRRTWSITPAGNVTLHRHWQADE